MKSYEKNLLEASLDSGALKVVGEFTLKSGRSSPYFWNDGMMSKGTVVAKKCDAYADKLIEIGVEDENVVFGPSYKASALAVGTVIKLSDKGIEAKYAYDRKEKKEYGDKADKLIVGTIDNDDSVWIVDDVITTGLTKKTEIALLNSLNKNLKISGILVGMDRMELDDSGNYASAILTKETGVPVHSILNAPSVFEMLHNREFLGKTWINDETYNKFQNYYSKYGILKGAKEI